MILLHYLFNETDQRCGKMVDIILKYEHKESVKDVPFEARWFIYFSIEKSFGENLAMLEE